MKKNIKRGEIRICDLKDAAGSIQRGTRPCLILQNNKGNRYSPSVIVAPLTSKAHSKKTLPTHMILSTDLGLKEESLLLMEQIMTIPMDAVGRKVCVLPGYKMRTVETLTTISLGMSNVQKRFLHIRKKGRSHI